MPESERETKTERTLFEVLANSRRVQKQGSRLAKRLEELQQRVDKLRSHDGDKPPVDRSKHLN